MEKSISRSCRFVKLTRICYIRCKNVYLFWLIRVIRHKIAQRFVQLTGRSCNEKTRTYILCNLLATFTNLKNLNDLQNFHKFAHAGHSEKLIKTWLVIFLEIEGTYKIKLSLITVLEMIITKYLSIYILKTIKSTHPCPWKPQL
jgi:hypothetical protein